MTIPKRALIGTALLALGLAASAAQASTVVYILDGSNSMWGQIDGTAKIDTAKSVLGGLLSEAPDGIETSLIAYGHRSETACDDIEVLSRPGERSAAELASLVGGISPTGRTPIAASLKAAGDLVDADGAPNTVVLVSDGIETCDADPCEVAAALAGKGIDTKVHVVGFDVDAEERSQLECIATKGGGTYFAAANADELTNALKSVEADIKAAAVAAPAAPAETEPVEPATVEPSWVEVFVDDFDGSELASHWTVANTAPDTLLVDNGTLLLLTGFQGGLRNENLPNRLELDPALLPTGDWEIEIAYDAEFSSGLEVVGVGLFDATDDWIAASAVYKAYSQCDLDIYIAKKSGESDPVSYGQEIDVWRECDSDISAFADRHPVPARLKLIKEGRAYRAEFRFSDMVNADGSDRWISSSPVSSLSAPAIPVVYAAQRQDHRFNAETLYHIDSVTIRAKQ